MSDYSCSLSPFYAVLEIEDTFVCAVIETDQIEMFTNNS